MSPQISQGVKGDPSGPCGIAPRPWARPSLWGPGTHRLCLGPSEPPARSLFEGTSGSACPPPPAPDGPSGGGGWPASSDGNQMVWGGRHRAVPSLCESVLGCGMGGSPRLCRPPALLAWSLRLAWCTAGRPLWVEPGPGACPRQSQGCWAGWEGAPGGARGGGHRSGWAGGE